MPETPVGEGEKVAQLLVLQTKDVEGCFLVQQGIFVPVGLVFVKNGR